MQVKRRKWIIVGAIILIVVLCCICLIPIFPSLELMVTTSDDITYYCKINPIGVMSIMLLNGEVGLTASPEYMELVMKDQLKTESFFLMGKRRFQVFSSIKTVMDNGAGPGWYSVFGLGIKNTAAIINGKKYWSKYYEPDESRSYDEVEGKGDDTKRLKTVREDLIALSDLIISLAPVIDYSVD